MNTYREYTQYLLDQIPIESVVEKLGRPVVRAGKENKCLCFFHNDTRPSMILYKSRQYHCYSCGAHGNIFTLVQTQKNIDFKGAVEWLEEEFPYECFFLRIPTVRKVCGGNQPATAGF